MNERYTLGYSQTAVEFLLRRKLETHGAFFLPYLKPDMAVLDCGCGPGGMTCDIAERVVSGSVIGVDMNQTQVSIADDNAAKRGLVNVSFRQANVYELPFKDAQFDAVFSHALFEHLREPLRGVQELKRVLRPGGVLALATPDWGGFLASPPSEQLSAAMEAYKSFQQRNGGDVYTGRKLSTYLFEAGFERIHSKARYEHYQPLSVIGELLAFQLEDEGMAQHAATFRQWQGIAHGMFAQAWVGCVGIKP